MAWSRLFSDQDRNQVIVIGASIAGLMTASVMTNRFDGAIVRDRDELPERLLPRHCVPQKYHVRLLLERCKRICVEFRPDLTLLSAWR